MRRRGFQSGSSEEFVEELRELRGSRLVVDIGAGRGGKARWLVERGGVPYVVAVEINPRYLEAMGPHPFIERVQAAAEALPIRSGAAHGLLAWNVLMWTEMPRAVREMRRVAKPGARLVLSVYRVRTGRKWTRGEVRRLVEEAGFRPEVERYSGVQYRMVARLPAIRVVLPAAAWREKPVEAAKEKPVKKPVPA